MRPRGWVRDVGSGVHCVIPFYYSPCWASNSDPGGQRHTPSPFLSRFLAVILSVSTRLLTSGPWGQPGQAALSALSAPRSIKITKQQQQQQLFCLCPFSAVYSGTAGHVLLSLTPTFFSLSSRLLILLHAPQRLSSASLPPSSLTPMYSFTVASNKTARVTLGCAEESHRGGTTRKAPAYST